MKKEELVRFCSDLEDNLKRSPSPRMFFNDVSRKVEFFSGLKPDNYYLPAMHIGTSKSIPEEQRMAWFVEIFVYGQCVFRDSMHILDNSEEDVEAILINRVFKMIFNHGVMAAFSDIIDSKWK